MKVFLRCLDPTFDQFIRICLERAGMHVVDNSVSEADIVHTILISSEADDPDHFKQELAKEVEMALASVDSKIIVWNRIPESNSDLAISLDKAINEVKYKQLYNIRSRQFIKVIDDIRFILKNDLSAKQARSAFDMVFVYNILEHSAADRIHSMLNTVLSVKSIEFNQLEPESCLSVLTEFLPTSQWIVFYANDNLDWMIGMQQETWNLSGGVDGKMNFLLTTDNTDALLTHPALERTTMISIETDLLPLEIKMQLDHIVSGA